MPTRVIREGILDSERIGALTPLGELFYRKLMSLVDDFGRYEYTASVLRARLYSQRIDSTSEADIHAWVKECADGDKPLVTIYEANGKNYLQINDFGQQIKAQKSKCPDPPCTSVYGRVREIESVHSRASTPSPTPYTSSSSEEESARETKTVPASVTAENAHDEFSDWANAVYARHPKKKHMPLVMHALQQRFARDGPAREVFDRNHRLWCDTPEWKKSNGIFAPLLCDRDGSGFINDEAWKYPPAEASDDFWGISAPSARAM